MVHCRDNSLAETTLTIPESMPAGQTVIRWLWYGAMKTDGTRVTGPEHSLFLNCFDVTIGTHEQCKNPPTPCVVTTTTTTSTPSSPHQCGATGACLCSPGMNNGGNNMLDHAVITDNEAACCDYCQQTEGCIGWTFVGGSGKECWIKDRLGDLTVDGSVTSGSIGEPSFCPGGSLDACVDGCPTATFKSCIQDCKVKCSSEAVI